MMFYFCTFARTIESHLTFFSAIFEVSPNVQNPVARMNDLAGNDFGTTCMMMCRVLSPEDYKSCHDQKGIRRYTLI